VTICGEGVTSLIAAEQLRARGFEALSLAGGMKAWSLAWNSAEVSMPGSQARVIQVRRTGKGCLSYLIGSQGSAAVIDAALEPGDLSGPGPALRLDHHGCFGDPHSTPTTCPAPAGWPNKAAQRCICQGSGYLFLVPCVTAINQYWQLGLWRSAYARSPWKALVTYWMTRPSSPGHALSVWGRLCPT
jgi:hypothetical protein